MDFSNLTRAVVRIIYSCKSGFYGCSQLVRHNAPSVWAGCGSRRFWTLGLDKPSSGGNAEEVRTLLKNYGFDDAHLSEIIRRCPAIFTLRAKTILKPKLEFFNSIGVSKFELPKFVLRWPVLLASSLENKIIPSYNYLRSITKCEEQHFVKMLKYRPGILLINVKTCLSPNVELLRGLGVPMSSIAYLVVSCSPTVSRKHSVLQNYTDQLVALGMNPLLKTFITALHVRCSMSAKTWDHKLKLFNRFGMSEDDIMLTFKKQPYIMSLSEKKLVRTMGFFQNEMSMAPEAVIRCPGLLLLSFEKRIRPRCHVMNKLVMKGLVKKFSCSYFLFMNDEMFLSKFLYGFKDDIPELMDEYGNLEKSRQGNAQSGIPSD